MNLLCRLVVLFCLLLTARAVGEEPAVQPGDGPRVLRNGWYLWDPYQYESFRNEQRMLTGLDVRLVQEMGARAGYEIQYEFIEWGAHQQALRAGTKDIAAGAFKTPERETFCYFSEPYRKEYNVLIMRRGETERLRFTTPGELLQQMRATSFRLGATTGYAYALPEMNDYLADPANRSTITFVETEKRNFENLLSGQIDGFFADRIVAQTVAWRNGWQARVEEHPSFTAAADIYVIFSKTTTSPQQVAQFNSALSEIRQDGTYNRIIREYLFPILLSITIQKNWFLGIDIIGTIAFAISGLMLARKEHYSLMGACVLAALPAIGGGITRDLIVNRDPVGVLRTPIYLLTILLTVAFGYLFLRVVDWLGRRGRGGRSRMLTDRVFTRIVGAADALGLAAFTIIGVVVAVEARCSPLWIWGPLLACLTGAGGGILRDVVRADRSISSLKGDFYAEVALIWGCALAFFLEWQTNRLNPTEVYLGVLVTLVGAFLTRFAAMHWRWRSPMF
jgi:polar amino acid transport system substrate-binding protein